MPRRKCITGCPLISLVNRTQVFLQKCHGSFVGGMLDKMRVHAQCTGRRIAWVFRKLHKLRKNFDPGERSRKAERFHRITVPSPFCVCISTISDSLLLYSYVNNKESQGKKQIIFLDISVVVLPFIQHFYFSLAGSRIFIHICIWITPICIKL